MTLSAGQRPVTALPRFLRVKKKWPARLQRILDVEVQNLELSRSERLLLCSDGLSGMIGDKQIWDIVEQAENIQAAVDSLIYMARERGGEDNITVILVEWEPDKV